MTLVASVYGANTAQYVQPSSLAGDVSVVIWLAQRRAGMVFAIGGRDLFQLFEELL